MAYRGGSYDYPFGFSRSSKRNSGAPGYRAYNLGFRLAMMPSSSNSSSRFDQTALPPGQVAAGTPWRSPQGIEFAYVPSGSFDMGSADGKGDEKPVHRVTISQGFYLGKTEVTQAQWKAVMSANPSKHQGDTLPVEQVPWDEVQEFIRRLNAQSNGVVYRLPTEAEWEYACRAGTIGPYAGDLDAMAWYANNSGNRIIDADRIWRDDYSNYQNRIFDNGTQTHAVGTKQANAWGLYDMHGNVSEWCQDRYDVSYYSNSPVVDPAGVTTGEFRMMRGGSWYNNSPHVSSAARDTGFQRNRFYMVGFRVVAARRTS